MKLQVSAIKEGTVIDHIPIKNVFKVIDILNLKEHEEVVSVAANLPSKKLGKKGMVKIGGKSLSDSEVSKISVIAPRATINIIKDYKVKKKMKVKLPEEFVDVIKCSNPKCITNAESVGTKFSIEKENPLKVRCLYCERSVESPDIEVL